MPLWATNGPIVNLPDDLHVKTEAHRNDIERGSEKAWRKFCPLPTLSNINPTWTLLAVNLDLCDEKQVTKPPVLWHGQ
jgi:hypothetical protein